MKRTTLSYGSLSAIELATLGAAFALTCFGAFAVIMGST